MYEKTSPEISFHIGYHKSASTFLQEIIFPNLKANYQFLGQTPRRYILFETVFDPGQFQELIKSRMLADQRQSPLLISNEILSGHPHGHNRINPFQVADRIFASYPQANILCVIRNQVDYLLSIYAFRVTVKGFETRTFEQFVREEGELGMSAKLHYQRLIQHYYQTFSPAQVTVIPMETLKHDHDLFWEKLKRCVGQVPAIGLTKTKRVNPSTRLLPVIKISLRINRIAYPVLLKLEQANTPRIAKAYRWTFYRMKRKVTAPLLNKMFLGSEKLQLSPALYDDLITQYRDCNRKLSEMIRIDLSQYGYPT